MLSHRFSYAEGVTDGMQSRRAGTERAIRPAVIIRKNSQSNRSPRDADTQAILMSVYRTLKQREHPPLDTIKGALETYMCTGHLSPLPPKTTTIG